MKEEQIDQMHTLLKNQQLCDLLLYSAHSISYVGSLESIDESLEFILSKFKLNGATRRILIETAGSAHMMMLDLEKAAEYFKASESPRMTDLRDVCYWYPRYPQLAKELLPEEQYKEFLVQKALPLMHLKHDGNDFLLDSPAFDFVLQELQAVGIDHKSALEKAVLTLETSGNQNVVRRLLLAQHSGNLELTERAAKEYLRKQNTIRQNMTQTLQEYAALDGFKYICRLQSGDYDQFFPIASSLYMLEQKGRKEIWKEHLRLYVDFSRLDGYNQEKEIYESVRHDSMINYLGSVKTEGIEFLRFEYFPGKELTKYCKSRPLLPVNESSTIVMKLAELLDYLHSKNVVYMDIKDKNVLYDGTNIKLLDFGMAQIGDDCRRSLLSTPEYVPPEMAACFKASKASDIFQLGILFHELLTGKHPFAVYNFSEGDTHRESEIIKYCLPNMVKEYKALTSHSELNPLLESMLQKDYRKRPSANEVVERLKEVVT